MFCASASRAARRPSSCDAGGRGLRAWATIAGSAGAGGFRGGGEFGLAFGKAGGGGLGQADAGDGGIAVARR